MTSAPLPSRRRFLIALSATGLVIAQAAHAGAAPRPAIAVGVCTGDLEGAKAAGFDYVELAVRNLGKMTDEEFAKFQARHKAAGIPTPVGNSFLPKDLPVVGPNTNPDQQMAFVRRAFDHAQKLGLKIIVFGSGDARRVPDGFSKDEAFKQLVAFAKRIAPEAKKRGIVLAVEPLRQKETNIINTAAEGLKWVQAVKHPNFQLMVDFFHLAVEKEDPSILVSAKKHIKHFHIANPDGRVYPLDPNEYDYSGFFANLRKMGFRGGISVEASTKDFAVEGPKAIAFLREAISKGVPAPPVAEKK